MEANSELLLCLYRAACELETLEFQRFAIQLLRPLLSFQSTLPGTGVEVTATPRSPCGPLSPRVIEVSTLFARGLQAKEIARMFGVSTSTVRNQLASGYRALGVSNRKGLRAALVTDRDSGRRCAE